MVFLFFLAGAGTLGHDFERGRQVFADQSSMQSTWDAKDRAQAEPPPPPSVGRHSSCDSSECKSRGFWKESISPSTSSDTFKTASAPLEAHTPPDKPKVVTKRKRSECSGSNDATSSAGSLRAGRKRLRITIPPPQGTVLRVVAPQRIGSGTSSESSGECKAESWAGPSHGVCSRRGRRRDNEDCHLAVPDLLPGRAPPVGFFGVFDGHGGARCAEFVAENLAGMVSRHVEGGRTPRTLFTSAFEQVDSEFLALAQSRAWDDGSTALVALLRGTTLTVANAGDSMAVLASQERAVTMSSAHTPGREDEKRRIERKGGRVVFMRTWRVEARLAVSRAIGNRAMKQYITAEPDVRSRPLTQNDDFLILGTDGLWNYVKPQEAVTAAADFIMRSNPPQLEQAAVFLTDLAFDRGSQDNITTLVVDLRDFRGAAAPEKASLAAPASEEGCTEKGPPTVPEFAAEK